MPETQASSDIIRRILLEDSTMPRQRYQDPKIQQNKNGSYYIRPWVDVIGESGLIRQKKTIVLGPATLGARKASTEKARVMKTINQADYVIKSQVVVSAFIDGDYTARHIRKLAESAKGKYLNLIKNHIMPTFGPLMFCEITPRRVDDWMQTKLHLSYATRLDLRNILSSIFTQAAQWGIWKDASPVKGLDCGPKTGARAKVKISDNNTRRFLAALPADLRLLCCVALFCTLRISECLGLREKHLDFERGLLLVRESHYRGVPGDLKNRKARRDVPMGYLAADLKRMCTGDPERHVFQIRTRPHWGRDEAICRDDRDLNQHFIRPVAKALGIYTPGFGFHSLRREAVTSIAQLAGINQAMSASGHSTTDMSLLYTLQDLGEQDKAIRSHQERIMGTVKGEVQ